MLSLAQFQEDTHSSPHDGSSCYGTQQSADA
jgi:hypothetical protein